MVDNGRGQSAAEGGLTAADIDCVFAGDLINQCTSSTFGLRQEGIRWFGIYGACSTMTEGLVLASLITDGLGVRRTMAVTSSHFCTAERQYRYPLEYGGVRPPSAQWTATAAGAVVVECAGAAPYVRAVTVGAIEDKGVKDTEQHGGRHGIRPLRRRCRRFSGTWDEPERF
jgi:stage V sporulation protein AD